MYERHFNLRELPFNITPDPRFFYTNPSCREALATLCYGIEYRKGIILVTGEAGTGKTTLLKLFMQNAAPQVRAALILDPHLSFVELLRCALDSFGLAQIGENRIELIERLKHYLLEQRTYHHRVALLLDEAQELAEPVLEELRLLSDLEHSGEKLLQLVLIGQPELESRLDQEKFRQLRQRITLRSHVAPLDVEEIGPYIGFRLRAAGYSGKSIFRAPALQRIGYFSKGIPRLVNVICDNALLIGCATSQHIIGAEIIDEIAADLQLGGRVDSLQSLPPGAPVDMSASARVAEAAPAGKIDEISNQSRVPRSEAASMFVHAGMALERLAGPRVQRFFQRWWLEMSAAAVTAVVVSLGGIYLRQPDVSPSRSSVAGTQQNQEALAPVPERIYRNFMEGWLRESSFKESTRPAATYEEHERADADKALEKKKSAGDRGKSAKAAQSQRLAVVETKRPASVEPQKTEARRPQSGFAVVDNSYVRDKPTSKADVIATLRPGTHIQVVGRFGDYFEVRSLDNEAIRGYVHKEDAFFQPAP